MTRQHRLPALPEGDLWVFGYGSLLWRPGFEYSERHRARIFGFHRSLCVWSWFHRGCRDRPGLVFGLDSGGSCVGEVFRVSARARTQTLDYLVERELVTPAYRARLTDAQTAIGAVQALTFTADRSSPQYAGRLQTRELLAVIDGACGESGDNRDYVLSTAKVLSELAIHDRHVHQLAAELDD